MPLGALVHQQHQQQPDPPGAQGDGRQARGGEAQAVQIPLHLLEALFHGVELPGVGGARQGKAELIHHAVSQLHREVDPVEILALLPESAGDLRLFGHEHRVRREGVGAGGPVLRQSVDADDRIFFFLTQFRQGIHVPHGGAVQPSVPAVEVHGIVQDAVNTRRARRGDEILPQFHPVPHRESRALGLRLGDHQHPGPGLVLLRREAAALQDAGVVLHKGGDGLQILRTQHGETVQLPLQRGAVIAPKGLVCEKFLHVALKRLADGVAVVGVVACGLERGGVFHALPSDDDPGRDQGIVFDPFPLQAAVQRKIGGVEHLVAHPVVAGAFGVVVTAEDIAPAPGKVILQVKIRLTLDADGGADVTGVILRAAPPGGLVLRVRCHHLLHLEQEHLPAAIAPVYVRHRGHQDHPAVAAGVPHAAPGKLPPQPQQGFEIRAVGRRQRVDAHGLHALLALQPVPLLLGEAPLFGVPAHAALDVVGADGPVGAHGDGGVPRVHRGGKPRRGDPQRRRHREKSGHHRAQDDPQQRGAGSAQQTFFPVHGIPLYGVNVWIVLFSVAPASGRRYPHRCGGKTFAEQCSALRERGNGGRFVNRPYGQGRPSVGAGPRTARSYFPVRPNFRAVEGASPYAVRRGRRISHPFSLIHIYHRRLYLSMLYIAFLKVLCYTHAEILWTREGGRHGEHGAFLYILLQAGDQSPGGAALPL